MACLLHFAVWVGFPFRFLFMFLFSDSLFRHSDLGSSCNMTKRDSFFAGFTLPSSSMSMPRRHYHSSGYPGNNAAPSDSSHPSHYSAGYTEHQSWPTHPGYGFTDFSHHQEYSAAVPSLPLSTMASYQSPILPQREESYPLQQEIEEQRRQLHAHYFTEVRTPQAVRFQPDLRRLMVTEVDQHGVHRNRQPEFFFNGIIGHIRADRHGWINSWDQSTQLANYWRRNFNIPEVHSEGQWHHHPQGSESENPSSLPGTQMDDTDSIVVNPGATPAPSQIHQLATVLWNILNTDREANLAILEKLEDPGDDLSTHPVQIFTAADLAHLASHLAQTTQLLSQQALQLEELSEISD